MFENSQFEYVQNHLRILSAFYGVLKPMDGVTPYRLEMQAIKKSQTSVGLYAKQSTHKTSSETEYIKELDKLVD